MKKSLLIIIAVSLWVSSMAAGMDVDSLYSCYQNNIGFQKQAVAKKLIGYFVQKDYYNCPVSLDKKYDRSHTDMLINFGMSKIAYHRADLDKAEQYARAALFSVDKDSILWEAACQEILAETYLRKGRLGDALKLVKANYYIGKKAGNDEVVSYSLSMMSGINFSFFKYEEALGYINEAIVIERKNKNTKRLAVYLGVKSDILLKLNRADSSLSCINEALKLDEDAQRKDKIGIRLSQKADILIHTQKWNAARTICLEAHSIFKKSNAMMDEAKTHLQLGCCERNLGNYESAERYLKSGEGICKSIGYKSLLWEIQYQLFLLYKNQNLFDKALSYYESSVVNRDSVVEEEYMYQLGDYKAKFDLQEKENLLALSKEKNRHKIVVICLLGVLLLLSILLVLHIMRIAKIRKVREEELAELNAAKDKIFSIVSHDLKNPVAAQNQVLGYLDSQYDLISNQEKKEMVSMMRQSNNSLSELLLELFDWASLNSGRMEYNPIRANLFSILQSTLKKVSIQALAKGIGFENKVASDTFVYADLVMLETVFRNILSNAVKFSCSGDTIEIMVEEKEKEVLVSVVDHGVGMSKETMSKLFKQSITTVSGTAGEKGTGLGLKICKSLVEMNQGQLFVQSKEGEGSTFSFTLPKA